MFRFRFSLLALTSIALSGLVHPTVLVADSVLTEQRTVTRLAEGVYVIRHKDSPDGNLNGNTTVIIGSREVFVVDSCFQLSAAAEDVAQIRRWTDKPVRYLLNTHWHNDHNMGNGIYQAAFPELAIVAHADTKRDMYRSATTPSRFAQQIATREQRLASRTDAEGKPLTDVGVAAIEKSLAGKKQVLQELGAFRYQEPTVTFEHELDIDIGDRTIQIRHLGRGATTGDAIVYLPGEKILIAGDLLTYPVLYTYGGYPSEWIETLTRMGQLGARAIVPGHGDVQTDARFLVYAQNLLRSAVDQVRARLRALSATIEYPSLEEVRKGVDLSPFRQSVAQGDADTAETFDAATAALVRVAYNEAMHNR